MCSVRALLLLLLHHKGKFNIVQLGWREAKCCYERVNLFPVTAAAVQRMDPMPGPRWFQSRPSDRTASLMFTSGSTWLTQNDSASRDSFLPEGRVTLQSYRTLHQSSGYRICVLWSPVGIRRRRRSSCCFHPLRCHEDNWMRSTPSPKDHDWVTASCPPPTAAAVTRLPLVLHG